MGKGFMKATSNGLILEKVESFVTTFLSFQCKIFPACSFCFSGQYLFQEEQKIAGTHGTRGKCDEILDLLATFLAI